MDLGRPVTPDGVWYGRITPFPTSGTRAEHGNARSWGHSDAQSGRQSGSRSRWRGVDQVGCGGSWFPQLHMMGYVETPSTSAFTRPTRPSSSSTLVPSGQSSCWPRSTGSPNGKFGKPERRLPPGRSALLGLATAYARGLLSVVSAGLPSRKKITHGSGVFQALGESLSVVRHAASSENCEKAA